MPPGEHEPVPPQENSDLMTDRIIPYGLRGKLGALGALEASRRALPNFRFSRRHGATWAGRAGACLVHGRSTVDKSKIDRAEASA